MAPLAPLSSAAAASSDQLQYELVKNGKTDPPAHLVAETEGQRTEKGWSALPSLGGTSCCVNQRLRSHRERDLVCHPQDD